MLGLRRATPTLMRAGLAPALRSGALAPAGIIASRPFAHREQSSAPSKALSKMGSLSVDRLAASPAVQNVEYVLTGLDRLVNWARKSSMWPMTFGLA